ncbi:MAG TPA: hypothetical protein VGX22_13415 [Candidatus Dormibacteraeota bacterium]|nr:hypothetical protein [Candidatus Dormibacteraeota bacterium]
MNKRTTTRWYIGAWVVWVVALAGLETVIRSTGSSVSPSPTAVMTYAVMAGAGIVMLVVWIGGLAKLGMQHAGGWFVVVLVLQLVALGIVGMVAYAIWGPPDIGEVVIRPTTT